MEDIYSNKQIEFHKKKVEELKAALWPIQLELDAHSRQLGWEKACLALDLVDAFGWIVDKTVITVRYEQCDDQQCFFAGVDERSGLIMLKKILENKKPAELVHERTELCFIDHPPYN